MAAKEVKEAAGAKGLAWATLRRAKDAIGVCSKKAPTPDGGWLWLLPDGVEDAQVNTFENSVSAFNKNTDHGTPNPATAAPDAELAAKAQVTQERILAVLKTAERPLYADQIAERAGIREAHFDSLLNFMGRSGIIKMVGSLVMHPDRAAELLHPDAEWRDGAWRQNEAQLKRWMKEDQARKSAPARVIYKDH